MFINKLKTKSNGVLNRMVSNTERIHNFFGRARAKQMGETGETVAACRRVFIGCSARS